MASGRVDRADRTIAASAAAIFKALTDRQAVAEWLPPRGATGEIAEFDPRPGGPFQMTLRFTGEQSSGGKTTEDSDTVEGRFTRVEKNRLVEQAIEFDSDDPAFAGTMRMAWLLEAVDAATTNVRVEAHDVPPGITEADHLTGLRSSVDNLADWVGQHAPPGASC